MKDVPRSPMSNELQSAARDVLPLLYCRRAQRDGRKRHEYQCRSCWQHALEIWEIVHNPHDCPVARLERAVREEERR